MENRIKTSVQREKLNKISISEELFLFLKMDVVTKTF